MSATGIINNSGKLSMYMGELNEFFKQHKGERIVARFFVAPKSSSAALKAYYYNSVVPSVRQALAETGERKTEKDTELFLRQNSPIMQIEKIDEISGKYFSELRQINDCSNAELIEHIDTIKQFAAENLNVYIEDPKML
jgi:hypothetical protein